MRVHQLLREETFKEYIQRLIKTFGRRLGKGVAGSVFPHPTDPNIAVKVFGNDPAYNDFLKWAHEHQHNPYVPKIYGVNTAKVDDGFITVAFFERLMRITDRAYFDFSAELFKIAYPRASLTRLPNRFKGTVEINDFTTKDWGLIAQNSKDKNLAEFAAFMAKPGRHNDIHRNNIMRRTSDRHLVFIDPSSTQNDPTWNTLVNKIK